MYSNNAKVDSSDYRIRIQAKDDDGCDVGILISSENVILEYDTDNSRGKNSSN